MALAWRSARAKGGPGTRAPWGLLLPWAGLALTALAFTIGRTHPLFQYNDDASARAWYGAWGSGWLVLMPGTLVMTVVAAILSVRSAWQGGPGRWARVTAWVAVALANGASVPPILANFPSV